MEYRQLGKSGLKVSQICLGTMNFGDSTDPQGAASILDAAREAGVNFIDTADGYVNGKSEEILGELIKNDRDDWVLATKVGQAAGSDKRKKGLSRKWMMEAVDASLQRLQTDYVDIYYMHHVDWETPLEESVAAMGDIIASGKALHWGFSNHRGWQIGELIRLCDMLGVSRPVICQPHYNAMMRLVETDILPACEYYGIGVNPFSPLARGVLTGKYTFGADPDPESRAGRGDGSILNRDFRETNFQFVDAVKKQIDGRDLTVIDFAMLWLFNNSLVTSIIVGPRTLEQFEAYLTCIGKEFTAEDEALVNELCATGCATSHNFIDPRYPPTGRRPVVG
ncbi:MAG TPA: NADP-dependent oxidoreductase [Rhodospirillaceae bacterium]|nr:NADP-dependent oxidoreductase [Rhodospirillaceae bacterium]HAA91015.1 NADP-dependent oxidoreductase [Rhodospirillaceae bacterium]HAT34987.1 NADP-dependent oxidoreductase [Rhodospirillaceae bacterium]